MKKTLFFLLLLLAGGTAALAQPLQTLTYENGAKFMEGRWTFTMPNLLPAYQGIQQHAPQEVQPRRPGDKYRAPKDAHLQMRERGGYPLIFNAAFYLNITPEGLVTYWPWEGESYTEITYKAGVPNGPFTEYYAPQKVLQRGNMVNGMAHGPWTYYYQNGKPFYTGTYKGYSQAQMQDLWQRNYNSVRSGPAGELNKGGPYDREVYVSNGIATQLPFYKMFLAGMQKDGLFTFYQPNGAKWAEMTFAEDVPAGRWRLWEEGRKAPYLELQWTAGGKISTITDSNGTRNNLADYVAGTARSREAALYRQQVEVVNMRDIVGVEVNSGISSSVTDAADPGGRNSETADPNAIFTAVQQWSEFPGNLNDWLKQNLRYPPAAKAEGIEGRVVIKFVVERNGSVSNAVVEKGVEPSLDAEALRLVQAMPKWIPARQNGKAVRVYFRVPVKFRLN